MAGGSGREQFLPWRHGPLSPNGGHPVIWQLGEEVERYPDVHEWLGSVNAYLLEDIERMEAGESPSPTGGLVTTLWQRRRRGAVGLSDSSAEASATGSPSFLIGWFVAGAGDVDVAQRGAGPVEVDTGRVQSPHGRAARVVKGGEQQVMRADRDWTRQSGRCGQDRLDRWGGPKRLRCVHGLLRPGYQLDDGGTDGREVAGLRGEDLGAGPVAFGNQAEQDLFGPDVVVPQSERLAQRQLEHLLRPQVNGMCPRTAFCF